MSRLILGLVAPLAVLAAPAWAAPFASRAVPAITTEAQEESFEELERRGIAEHTAGEYRKSVETFKRCFELRPTNATAAYNVACSYSRLEEKDEAFVWLDKAAELGFGNVAGRIDHVLVDGDMENVRDDPRFAKFVAELRRLKEELERYWKEPLVHLPPGHVEGEELGVLVVLHDLGSTKQAALDEWRPLADELGLALVAPGAMMLGSTARPTDGMVWFQDIARYRERYWHFEQPIDLALEAFDEAHQLDRSRVLLAGVGQGATVAFSQAMRLPKTYRGVLIDSGPVILDTIDTRKRKQAVDAGLKVRTICSKYGAWGLPQEGFEKRLESMGGTLATWNLGAPYSFYDPAVEGERERYRRVALKTLLPETTPTEASSPR